MIAVGIHVLRTVILCHHLGELTEKLFGLCVVLAQHQI